jgi:multidrug efflux pump
MKFTDLFIKRPVLATVVSLMLLLLGLYSVFSLQLREFPKTESTMITVSTSYAGASADVIQGFITQPLTGAIAQADGIDFMTSSSTQGSSAISVYMKLNYDPNAALTEILTKVNGVQNQLPTEAQLPVITKSSSDQFDLMYLGYSSKVMSAEQITDYLSRVIRPKLEAIEGVSTAEILGGQTFSMRIWLDPDRMTAFNITANDINDALEQNNFQSAAGQVKGELVLLNVTADTDLHDASKFENLVIKNTNGVIIRLRDVAKIELGSESYDSNVMFNGERAVFVGIATTPEYNTETVRKQVK